MSTEKITISEVVEQDTIDNEDISNLFEFLLPSSIIQSSCSQLGIHFNRRIFEGWVKQPSACCGAASVAGNKTIFINIFH
jgi:hypothetical protein